MSNKGYVFIGMSGSGKTTLGKIFARNIHCQFVDSDRLIEKKKGKPLQEIVDSYKDKKEFIVLEEAVIKEVRLNQMVLSTGGSTCYSDKALKALRGKIIFLRISWERLVKRLGSFDGRGVILFHPSFREEFMARQILYQQMADITIECDGKSIDELVKEIKLKTEFCSD